MTYYGPWQPGLIHSYDLNVWDSTLTKTWVSGVEGAEDGLGLTRVKIHVDSNTGRNWRTESHGPGTPSTGPWAYDNPSNINAVWDDVNAGDYAIGNPAEPDPYDEVTNPDGKQELSDEWSTFTDAGGSVPDFGYIGQGQHGTPGVPTPETWSYFSIRILMAGIIFNWREEESNPFYSPGLGDDVAPGAVNVQFDIPNAHITFLEAKIMNSDILPAYRFAGSGAGKIRELDRPNLAHPGAPFGVSAPSVLRTMHLGNPMGGAYEIPNFDAMRGYDEGAITAGLGDDDLETSLLFAPSGFIGVPPEFEPAANPFLPGVEGIQDYSEFLLNEIDTTLRITFQTAPYRYVYDTPPFAPPLRHTQRDDNHGPSPRNRPARSRQAGLRNTGYL